MDFQRWTSKRKSEAVIDVLSGNVTLTDFCREHDLKQSEVERWIKAFTKAGQEALSSGRSKKDDQEQKIDEYPSHGVRRITWRLNLKRSKRVNHKTVHRILKRKCWVVNKRPKGMRPRVQQWKSAYGCKISEPCMKPVWQFMHSFLNTTTTDLIVHSEVWLRVNSGLGKVTGNQSLFCCTNPVQKKGRKLTGSCPADVAAGSKGRGSESADWKTRFYRGAVPEYLRSHPPPYNQNGVQNHVVAAAGSIAYK